MMAEKFEPAHGQRSNTNIRRKIEVATTEASPWYIVGSGIRSISFDVIPADTAHVETTNDVDGARAGTAQGLKWSAGDVTAQTQLELVHMAAFRIVSTAGAVTAFVDGLV